MVMEAIMAVKEPAVNMIKAIKISNNKIELNDSFTENILDMEDYTHLNLFYYLLTAPEFHLNELYFSSTDVDEMMDILILEYERVQTLWEKINNLDESFIIDLCRQWVLEYESTCIYHEIPYKYQRLKDVCQEAYKNHGYLLVWGKR